MPPEERCSICNEEGPDLRTLILKNMYDLSEASDKLIKREDGFFQIRTCKSCRGDFIDLLGKWCAGEFTELHDTDLEANIPVRINGAIQMLTESEYAKFRSEKCQSYTSLKHKLTGRFSLSSETP